MNNVSHRSVTKVCSQPISLVSTSFVGASLLLLLLLLLCSFNLCVSVCVIASTLIPYASFSLCL
jgi:hypothetical protein